MRGAGAGAGRGADTAPPAARAMVSAKPGNAWPALRTMLSRRSGAAATAAATTSPARAGYWAMAPMTTVLMSASTRRWRERSMVSVKDRLLRVRAMAASSRANSRLSRAVAAMRWATWTGRVAPAAAVRPKRTTRESANLLPIDIVSPRRQASVARLYRAVGFQLAASFSAWATFSGLKPFARYARSSTARLRP